MKKFYAVCNVNGPISVRIEEETLAAAISGFEATASRGWIDDPRTDAEDDLDIAGEGMSEDQFEAALTAAGCTPVMDWDGVFNAHAGRAGHMLNGWYLWEAPTGVDA